MDVFEQCKKASAKDLKKVLKPAGKDGIKKTNDNGQTLIHTAAEGGNHEGLKLLLTKYKLAHFVNIKDGIGWTPLHYAAEGGHLECIDLLLHHGADVTATSRNGDSPLHYLVRGKGRQCDTAQYYKLLKIILNTKGVDVNAQNMNGESALHLSAMSGRDEVVNLLLNHGADVDLKSRAGETALHYATRYGHSDVVKTLLERNANPTVAGSNGTPLDIAERDQKRDIAELLSVAQAKQRKNSAPVTRQPSGSAAEERGASLALPASLPGTHSAPMPAVAYSPKPLPPVPRSASFDKNGQNGHTDDQWSAESLPSNQSLLRSCQVTISPRIPVASCFSSSSSSSWPPSPYSSSSSSSSSSPALLSSFLAQVDSALTAQTQRGANLKYDFTYERDILAHVEKEREALRLVEERRKEYEERNPRRAPSIGAGGPSPPAGFGGGGGSPFAASPPAMVGSGPQPIYRPLSGPESPMSQPPQQPMTPPYHLGGGPAGPYGQQPPPFNMYTATSPSAGPGSMHGGLMHAPHSSPSLHLAAPPGGGRGGGGAPNGSAILSQNSLASSEPSVRQHHPLRQTKPKSGSTGDLVRANLDKAKNPHGGVAVLPPLPHQDNARRGRSNSARQAAPLNSAQETLYLKVISEHEELNTENVHVAVKHCGNDPKAVIAYVKAYERIKPLGYSQGHVVEALKAYGGGAAGLSPQEEEVQHQRMLAFLKLLVNKGFSPATQVQNALSLFEYDVEKAEKFLTAYKTVSQMGFSDVQVREALLLSDSDSEQAIRYLLEGK